MKIREDGIGIYMFVGFVSALSMLYTLVLCYDKGLSEIPSLLLSLLACLVGSTFAFFLAAVFSSLVRLFHSRRSDAQSRQTHIDIEMRSGSRSRRS